MSWEIVKNKITGISRKQKRLLIVLVCIAVCCVVFLQVFSLRIVHDSLMAGTLEKGDCLLIAKHAYAMGDVGFGDIILHTSFLADDNGNKRELYTRVAGLPGDLMEVKEGDVFRNGEKIEGPSAAGGSADVEMPPSTLPPGCYFVLSDNRKEGLDSRDGRVGYITIDQIEGKAVFRPLPFSRIGSIDRID